MLKIGTDARVQVVNDEARPQGGYRARRALGQDVWKAEKDKERANKVAQQVRRAAALTAELAARSEKKTAAVCDQPPGLDELAGHMEAPDMGAGGSHHQATMMPDPWATYKCPSASDNQAEISASSETNRIRADRGVFAPELDEGRVTAKKTYRAGTASLSEERTSMGTDSHAENKRKLRGGVQGKSTGRHLQQ